MGKRPQRRATDMSPMKVLGLVGAIGLAFSAFPAFWTFSDHWMNRAEIEQKMKSHADHDTGVQAWNQFGFADNRAQYLADKAAECDAKRMVKQSKLAADELAICTRYESQLKQKQEEAMQLKSKALEATKEKP